MLVAIITRFLTASKIRVASERACAASQVVSGAGFNCGLIDCFAEYAVRLDPFRGGKAHDHRADLWRKHLMGDAVGKRIAYCDAALMQDDRGQQ